MNIMRGRTYFRIQGGHLRRVESICMSPKGVPSDVYVAHVPHSVGGSGPARLTPLLEFKETHRLWEEPSTQGRVATRHSNWRCVPAKQPPNEAKA